MKFILESSSPIPNLKSKGGGKATNMAHLSQKGFPVPPWFCVTSDAFDEFVKANNLQSLLTVTGDLAALAKKIEDTFSNCPLPPQIESEVSQHLQKMGLQERFVAVRSSGLDEDSAEHSFAGQFSSYLFQKGMAQVALSLKKCWASGFSERALSYRKERGLQTSHIQVGVVIQLMINADSAGVAFSRDPINPLDRDHLLISSVFGLGEGLVSGELDSDHFRVHRTNFETHSTIVKKPTALRQSPQGGVVGQPIPADKQEVASLTESQIREVAKLTVALEEKLGAPQDCEWGFEAGKLYCLQTRPITTLPCDAFYSETINGKDVILWDNSNIIESYSGVTSPLTFSFASSAYRQVYIQFCEVVGVPQEIIISHESMFRNMLGLLRGRIYYNLINWYRLVLLLPGTGSNKGFMETMMGVKQTLKPELSGLFEFMNHPPKYSIFKRLWVTVETIWRFIQIDTIIGNFFENFNQVYIEARKTNFREMSLSSQGQYYQFLDEKILRKWQAPIINDYLCMIFFGLLKKLTEKWLVGVENRDSLQNDLLCGQGDLESTEPTKMLMRLADYIDNGSAPERAWFTGNPPDVVLAQLSAHPDIQSRFQEFLDKYGFRCINELKLEEPDLHDDPTFAINVLQNYVRMKSYSVEEMEKREKAIRIAAEAVLITKLSGIKKIFYSWILNQTRRAVRNRENLRFARTKIFGVARHLFRGIGENLVRLGEIKEGKDVFYLTVEEILAYIEGRVVSNHLMEITQIRKKEFEIYKDTLPPPDRLLTTGAAGASLKYQQVLTASDLLAKDMPVSDDPNVLYGTPCCPGVIEGVVRVVNDMKDAMDLNGEILVTGRTDPGWVPLYPSCSGLLIERGSLLSHSAVVARELGLPTIVGVSGGLMTKLKTGQRVRVDAGRGEIRILV